ncbi:hypothetical protein THF1D04_500001 [Vibrio owensii]|uniref:Uncharacterized protein n=1 Tax=Vibrio owensii TaxID=696485 RepID=A0AAU9QAK3_9VIBR|nr:hypothetical protein THF1D04_500001 [Vibrio owensii]
MDFSLKWAKNPNITGLWLNINASHIAVGWVNYEGSRQHPYKPSIISRELR